MNNLISNSCDPLSKYYNNLWGSYTNTNMRMCGCSCWEISGHAVSYVPFFYNFLTGTSVPQSKFITLPKSWDTILKEHGLLGEFMKGTAGDWKVIIKPTPSRIQPGLICPENVKNTCYTSPIMPGQSIPVPED